MKRRALFIVLALAATLPLVASWLRTRNLGAVERGRAIAQAHGCFGCHGPGGVTGSPDVDVEVGSVPSFGNDDLTAYAHNADEIREWIADGMPRRLREKTAEVDEPPSLIRMPAFGAVLSAQEISDVVEYVKAVGDFEPPPPGPALEGRDVAVRMGCFACHGPQGRAAPPNPRSLFGYIPSWDGDDFPELAANDDEIRAWILDGAPQRLRDHLIARRFIDRQLIQMPAYRDRLTPADLDKILAYIHWLRRNAS